MSAAKITTAEFTAADLRELMRDRMRETGETALRSGATLAVEIPEQAELVRTVAALLATEGQLESQQARQAVEAQAAAIERQEQRRQEMRATLAQALEDVDGGRVPDYDAVRAALADPGEAHAISIVSADVFTASPMSEPPQVVKDVLHRGSKAVYGGPSKAFKSWTLLDLCLAVSTGGDWLGFETTPGPVLYLNFELQPFAVHKRLLAIAEDRDCAIPKALRLWNLRGHARPLSALLPELLRQIEGEGYALIVPDPIYKTMDGRDENKAGDIAQMCGEIDSVAVETGAAVAFGAHFAKGNASGKEHLDRVSGSGVWARDPDAIITATAHEADHAFAIEMTLRNFPPVEPFAIRWEYPRMVRDAMLDPSQLRQARGGRVEEFSVDSVLKYLSEPLTPGAWLKACADETGISRKTFYRRIADAERGRLIERDGKQWKRRNLTGYRGQRED